MPDKESVCKICSGLAQYIGERPGKLDNSMYRYFHCPQCEFSFVANPRFDYSTIYNSAYYQGQGADPLADYVYEIDAPTRTVRQYEWRGLLATYQKLIPRGGRWLDYGCGTGGLVRFVRSLGIDAMGCEEGWAAEFGTNKGIPIKSANDLEAFSGTFDFITAIEVFEHISQPMQALVTMRQLLKRGGVLFLITGNARPWRGRLFDWEYARAPDIHVSFFEPLTLEVALNKSGFEPKKMELGRGVVSIIQYKVLKNLRVRNRAALWDLLPWTAISWALDRRYQLSMLPYGIAV